MQETQERFEKQNELITQEITLGVRKTMGDAFGMKSVNELKRFNERRPEASALQVAGTIELNNTDTKQGMLFVSFPEETIFKIMGKFYRREFAVVERPVLEGVGEMTNMIFGVMKANLSRKGMAFRMALPNVLFGAQVMEKLDLSGANESLMVVLPFESEAGPFSVTLILYPAAVAAA